MKSILNLVLLAIFALVPVSAALADNNADNNNEVKSSSSENNLNMERNREGERSTSTDVGVDLRDSSSSDRLDVSRRGTSTDASSSDRKIESRDSSSTESSDRGNNRYGDKFKMGIASTTQNLINLSSRLGTIGNEIKALVAEQASSSDAISSVISKVEDRGAFKTFFLGSDYKNLGQLVSEVQKAQNRLNQMENQLSKVATSTDKLVLMNNIQSLKDQIATLNTFVKDSTSKFSLFGWFVKRFNK